MVRYSLKVMPSQKSEYHKKISIFQHTTYIHYDARKKINGFYAGMFAAYGPIAVYFSPFNCHDYGQ